jgi:hypothetical protein
MFKTISSLAPGRYMKVDKVNEFIQKYNSQSLPSILRLDTHQGEFDLYYSVKDLKGIVDNEFFRNMECDVVTHLILSEEDKLKWNSF